MRIKDEPEGNEDFEKEEVGLSSKMLDVIENSRDDEVDFILETIHLNGNS